MDVRRIQLRLNELRYGKLKVDGQFGPRTKAALIAFQVAHGLTADGRIGPKTLAVMFPKVAPKPKPTPKKKNPKLMETPQIMAKYGKPGPGNLVTIELPYTMKIAWDLNYIANKMQCHKLIAKPLLAVFNDLLKHYGVDELERLGIDLYGGCYSFRKKRLSNDWSTHAWGIAIDLDPARNSLKATSKTAQFAKPEYKAMHDIFYKHGFVGLGRECNRDWMHFQIAS